MVVRVRGGRQDKKIVALSLSLSFSLTAGVRVRGGRRLCRGAGVLRRRRGRRALRHDGRVAARARAARGAVRAHRRAPFASRRTALWWFGRVRVSVEDDDGVNRRQGRSREQIESRRDVRLCVPMRSGRVTARSTDRRRWVGARPSAALAVVASTVFLTHSTRPFPQVLLPVGRDRWRVDRQRDRAGLRRPGLPAPRGIAISRQTTEGKLAPQQQRRGSLARSRSVDSVCACVRVCVCCAALKRGGLVVRSARPARGGVRCVQRHQADRVLPLRRLVERPALRLGVRRRRRRGRRARAPRRRETAAGGGVERRRRRAQPSETRALRRGRDEDCGEGEGVPSLLAQIRELRARANEARGGFGVPMRMTAVPPRLTARCAVRVARLTCIRHQRSPMPTCPGEAAFVLLRWTLPRSWLLFQVTKAATKTPGKHASFWKLCKHSFIGILVECTSPRPTGDTAF